jgi:O-methyltransferase
MLTAIRKSIENLFGMLGIEAHLARKSALVDSVLFDKNMLSHFYNNEGDTRLYYEGLERTGMLWSDNFSKQCRFFVLQQMVRHALDHSIVGDFSECGCWKGHSTYVISRIIKESGKRCDLLVFDSFEGGLSEKSQKDGNERVNSLAEAVRREKEMFASGEEEVRDNLREFPFVHLFAGWIPERFPEVSDSRFCFVHIDVDLYQPTLDSLEFFFPRLSPGGVIVLDDYGFTQFPGCRMAALEFFSKQTCSLKLALPTGGAFLIK